MPDKKINIAVLVSGDGTNLQALINAEKKGIIKSGEIKLVISNRINAFALKRADKAGIKAEYVSRYKLGQKGFEQRVTELFEKNSIDLIVLAGFLCILTPDFTRKYDHRMINIHPSLIPSFCGEGFYGLRVHEAALEKGVKVTGATVHYVNEIPDDGEIIMQKAVIIPENITPENLQKRVMRLAEWKILPLATELVSRKLMKEG